MAYSRKLQGEIDKCLKKVAEGVEEFDEIWKKLQQATNANQKEKYEADLKKEIKKLQRHRDQIKNWIASSDIKDKSLLMDNRKLIETQMERFKAVEKEAKTKAYSKEGLTCGTKMDPKEKEKEDIRMWIITQIEELNIQVDKCEADIEALAAGKKKSSKDNKVDDLHHSLGSHRFHIGKLETILRFMDNDAIELENVKNIQDDVEYYITNNQDPDFQENEYLYDDVIPEEIVLAPQISNTGSHSDDDTDAHSTTSTSTATSQQHSLDAGASPPPASVPPLSLTPSATNHSSINRLDDNRKRTKSESMVGDERLLSFPQSVGSLSHPQQPQQWPGSNVHLNTRIPAPTQVPSTPSKSTPTSVNGNSSDLSEVHQSSGDTMANQSSNTLSSGSWGSSHPPPLMRLPVLPTSNFLSSLYPRQSEAPTSRSNGGDMTFDSSESSSTHLNSSSIPSSPAVQSPAVSTPEPPTTSTPVTQGSTPVVNGPTPPLMVPYSVAAQQHLHKTPPPPSLDSQQMSLKPLDSQQMNMKSLDSQQMNMKSFDSQQMNMKSFDSQQMNMKDSQHISLKSLDSQHNSLKSLDSQQMSLKSLDSQHMSLHSLDSQQLSLKSIAAQALQGTEMPQLPNQVQHASSTFNMYGSMAITIRSTLAPSPSGSSEHMSSHGSPTRQPAVTLSTPTSVQPPLPANVTASQSTTLVSQVPPPAPTISSIAPTATIGEAGTRTIHLNPILGVAPLGRIPLSNEQGHQLHMLEAAFQHLPHPADSERLRPCFPRNPCPTPTYYPLMSPSGSETLEFFYKLSAETLFFIFYYMEGTKAQFLAAKALKKQSWRFHTKYMMWFQRHEEPKSITEEYEQGTYIYFDYEKWGQRKKDAFIFEYKYLEDRDL